MYDIYILHYYFFPAQHALSCKTCYGRRILYQLQQYTQIFIEKGGETTARLAHFQRQIETISYWSKTAWFVLKNKERV
jgi:hypothetical protein